MFLKSFTREQLVLWIGTNFKLILSVFAVMVLIATSALIWNWQKKEQEYKVQASLYKLKMSLKALTKEDDSKNSFSFLKQESAKKELVLTEGMKQRASLYEQSIKKNQKFQTTVSFAVDLADFYYRYNQKEQAKELLSLFALPLERRSVYHLAVFQLAGYYMNERECGKALPLFSQLISNETALAFHLESRLQRALCLEFMNRSKEALEEYEKINIENSEDYIGRLAQDYKKLLILKEKLKK